MGISCGHQLGKADSAWNAGVPKDRNSADFKDFWERFGWGTWIRTRTNGVRVRGSTVNLFPSKRGCGEAHDRRAGFYIGSAISQYHALTLK